MAFISVQIKNLRFCFIIPRTRRYVQCSLTLSNFCFYFDETINFFFFLQLEGTLIFDSKPFLSTWDPDQKFDLTIEHKCGVDVLHKLSIVLVTRNDKAISNSKQSDQMKFDLDIVHTNKNNDLWMVSGKFFFFLLNYFILFIE